MRLTSVFTFVLAAAIVAGCFGGPESFEELTAAGDRAFGREQWDEARGHYQKALALKPSDRRSLYFTGLTFRRQNQFDSALAYVKRADLLHPGDREINLELHSLARETKHWRYAIDAIRVLIANGASAQDYWRELAELHARDSQPAMTYHYQKKVLELDSNSPLEYMRLINVALAIDSPDVARAYLDTAIAKFGERNEFLANKAFILAYQEEYEQAEALFRITVENDSTMLAYKLGLANALSYSDDRTKLRESLGLYREIRVAAGGEYNVDSMISVLETRLR